MSNQPIVRNTIEFNIKSQHRKVFNHHSDNCIAICVVLCFESQNKLLFNSSSAHSDAAQFAVLIRIILAILLSEDINTTILLVLALEALPVSQVKAQDLRLTGKLVGKIEVNSFIYIFSNISQSQIIRLKN